MTAGPRVSSRPGTPYESAWQTEIGWPVFAIAGFLALAVALITVSTQAIKAATANPAKTLKTE